MFRRIAMAAPIVVIAAASIPSAADAACRKGDRDCRLQQVLFDLESLHDCIAKAKAEFDGKLGRRPGAGDKYQADLGLCKAASKLDASIIAGLDEAAAECDESCAQAAVDEAAGYQPQQ